MSDNLIYEERVSSNRTEALFVGLMILSLMLLIFKLSTGSPSILSAAFFLFFVFFFFYSVNYRTLITRLTQESLKLKFAYPLKTSSQVFYSRKLATPTLSSVIGRMEPSLTLEHKIRWVGSS